MEQAETLTEKSLPLTDKEHASMPREKESRLGTLLTIISATSFGMMAIFAKYAYGAGLNLLTILSLRFAIAALVMWTVLLVKKENPRLNRRDILALLALGGTGYGLMSSLFFSSVRLIPAALASILLYTYPVLVTLLSAWVNKESLGKYKILSLFISSLGLVLVVGLSFKGLNPIGILCGVSAAVVYSIYIIASNKLVGRVDPLVVTAYVLTSGALLMNLVGWSTGAVSLDFGLQGWLAILAIAIVSSVIAILTFFQGMRLVGPSKASIISSMEPVVTTLAAFLIFGEKVSLMQIVGGTLVVAAVILVQKE